MIRTRSDAAHKISEVGIFKFCFAAHTPIESKVNGNPTREYDIYLHIVRAKYRYRFFWTNPLFYEIDPGYRLFRIKLLATSIAEPSYSILYCIHCVWQLIQNKRNNLKKLWLLSNETRYGIKLN